MRDRGDQGTIIGDTNRRWALLYEIEPGHTVSARRGAKQVAGIGTVTGPASDGESRGRERAAYGRPARRARGAQAP